MFYVKRILKQIYFSRLTGMVIVALCLYIGFITREEFSLVLHIILALFLFIGGAFIHRSRVVYINEGKTFHFSSRCAGGYFDSGRWNILEARGGGYKACPKCVNLDPGFIGGLVSVFAPLAGLATLALFVLFISSYMQDPSPNFLVIIIYFVVGVYLCGNIQGAMHHRSVWVRKGTRKFHKSMRCAGAAATKVDRGQAEALGYTACANCYKK